MDKFVIGLKSTFYSLNSKITEPLNGGTTNEGALNFFSKGIKGSMENYLEQLIDMKIKAMPFREPDLNNALTAISFLVDETVWDKEIYPDPILSGNSAVDLSLLWNTFGKKTAELRLFLNKFRLAIN